VAGWAEGVLLQPEALQRLAAHHGLHVNVCDKVLASLDVVDGGELEEDGRQAHQTVGGDVHELQRRADGHLGGEAGDPVTRQVQLCNKGEGEREFGRDL